MYAKIDNIADKGLTAIHIQMPLVIPRISPKATAFFCVMVPRGSGRLRVRFIKPSISLSIAILIEEAPPADKIPPIMVAVTIVVPGHAPSARNIAGMVVTKSNKTMEGFIRVK